MHNAYLGAVENRPASGVRWVGFTPTSALSVVAAVFVALIARNAFGAAHHVLGWVVASSVVALLIDPAVERLGRRIPRWAAVMVVLMGGLTIFAGLVVGVAREVRKSIAELQLAAPAAAAGLEDRYRWARDIRVVERTEAFVAGLDDALRDATLGRAMGTIPTYLVNIVLMLFLLGYGGRYVRGFVAQLDDPYQREIVYRVLTWGARRGRRYLLFALAHGAVNGIMFGLLCRVLGMSAPLSLGFAVGVFTVLPVVGVVIGGLPALLLALGLHTWPVVVVVVGAIVVLQLVEAVIVRPYVDVRSVRVGPALPVIVGLVAFELYGVGGAVYAIALTILGLAGLDAVGILRDDVVPAPTAPTADEHSPDRHHGQPPPDHHEHPESATPGS
ncbi:hypothetical protein BH24ACT5_BH24ACT5_09600 [soil metagenome]